MSSNEEIEFLISTIKDIPIFTEEKQVSPESAFKILFDLAVEESSEIETLEYKIRMLEKDSESNKKKLESAQEILNSHKKKFEDLCKKIAEELINSELKYQTTLTMIFRNQKICEYVAKYVESKREEMLTTLKEYKSEKSIPNANLLLVETDVEIPKKRDSVVSQREHIGSNRSLSAPTLKIKDPIVPQRSASTGSLNGTKRSSSWGRISKKDTWEEVTLDLISKEEKISEPAVTKKFVMTTDEKIESLKLILTPKILAGNNEFKEKLKAELNSIKEYKTAIQGDLGEEIRADQSPSALKIFKEIGYVTFKALEKTTAELGFDRISEFSGSFAMLLKERPADRIVETTEKGYQKNNTLK